MALAVAIRLLLPFAIERGFAWAAPRYLGLPGRIANVDLHLLRGEIAVEGLVIGSRPDSTLGQPAVSAAGPDPGPEAGQPATPPSDPASAEAEVEAEPETGAGAAPGAAGAEPATQTAAPAEGAAPAVEPTPAPDDVLLRWQRVVVGLDWGGLFHHRLHLRELRIEGPSLRLEQFADGHIDPLAAARPTAGPLAPAPEGEAPPPEGAGEGAPAEEGAPPVEPSKPWPVSLDQFALQGSDVRIVDAEQGTPLAVFELRALDLSDVVVSQEQVSLGSISIQDPTVRVRRDFALARGGGPSEAEAGGPAPDLSRYRLDRIDLDSGRFTWITDMGPLAVSMRLSASDVSLAKGHAFPIQLAVRIDEGSFEVDGQTVVVPPRFEGRVHWKDLPFPPLVLAAAPDLSAWLRSCRSHGDLQVSFRLAPDADGGPPGVRLSGTVALDDVSVVNPGDGKEVALAWQQLSVAAKEIDVPFAADGAPAGPIRVALEQVRLVAPDVLYTLPSPALDALAGGGAAAAPRESAAEPAKPAENVGAKPAENIEAKPAENIETAPAAAAPAPAGGTAVELDVGDLEVSQGRLQFLDRRGAAPYRGSVDGLAVSASQAAVRTQGGPAADVGRLEVKADALHFEDERVEPVYRGHLKAFSLLAQDLHWPGPEASQVRIAGRSADGGSFELTGSLHQETGEAVLKVDQLDLPPFNSYAASAAGYSLGGRASLDTRLRIRRSQYVADSDLVLEDLRVSSSQPGDFEKRFGVPLDLALALLRDPAGNISLSIPVTVEKGAARTGIASIVAGALRQALVGAITAPLKMLGAAFSSLQGGGPGVESMPSPPGEAALAPAADPTLAGLAKLLGERPELAVRLRGRSGEADRPEVAEQMLIERVEQGEGLPEIENGAGFFARRRITGALRERGEGKPGSLDDEDQALLDRYVAAVKVPADRLADLARARARAARDALVQQHGIEPARIDVAESAAPPGDPGVLIELETRSS